MSYLKISTSRLFLVARRNVAPCRPWPCVSHSLPTGFRMQFTGNMMIKQRNQSTLPQGLIQPDSCQGSATRHYTTSAKPHMTKSLMKWKKRKRKSKAQQQKEMENLQRDLVKLLTKRAIQVVRNKSLLGAQREVVTCHAFSHLGLHDQESSHALVVASLSPLEIAQQPWNKRTGTSDYIARTVEARLRLGHEDDQAWSGFKDGSRVADNASYAGNAPTVDHAFAQSEFSPKSQGKCAIGYSDNNATFPAGSLAVEQNTSLLRSKPILYSELFHGSMPRRKHSTENSTPNFQSAISSFTAELVSLNSGLTSDTKRDWDVDANLENIASEHLLSSATPSASNTEVISRSASYQKELKDESLKSREVDFGENLNKSLIQSSKIHSSPVKSDSVWSNNLSKSAISPIRSTSILPSIFVHDPIDGIDDAAQEQDFDGPTGTLGLKRTRGGLAPSLKKKLSKRSSDSSKKAGVPISSAQALAGSLPGVPHLEESPENVCVSQELREMLDKSFVETSCFTGCELLAVRNLQYHATKFKLTSVQVFNLLIHALAKKGDLHTIKSLFLLLRQQGLEPTLQTYAACLECMGRMPNVDIQMCQNLIADIRKQDLNLGDIARKCSFQLDEWDYVLKAIHMVEPDFIPNPLRFSSKYQNKLLQGLNDANEQAEENNQYAVNESHQEMMRRARQQLDMEVRGEVKVKSIAAADLKETLKPKTRELRNELLTEWRKVLLDSFDKKLAMYEKNAQDNINMTLYPFLKLFPREDYVNVIFKCLKDLLTVSAGYSPTMAMIKNDLGWAINRKYNTALRVAGGMDKKVMSIYEGYMEEYLDKDKRLDNHRLMWMRAMGQNYDTMNMDMSLKRWPGHIIREVGKFLLDMILYDLKVNANTFKRKSPRRLVPAFCTMVMSDRSRYTTAELKLHPVVSKLFAVDDSEFFSFSPSVVPMVVPPVPWISRNTGSLLLGSSALVRMRPSVGHVDPLRRVKESRYLAVLDSLNTLSSCAWVINKPILDLQIEVFNSKGDAKLKVATPASELPPLPVIKQDLPAKEKAELYKERLVLQQQRQDAHGLWCTDLYRLSIANKFRDETFWFPHSMDFRGRTYPLPPHFNHLGSDNVRGMLVFAKGKPLGENGYDWLKIHLINLTGLKKRSSNAERLEYADSIMEEILDSADRPLTGKKWWQASDEPWQTLACCMEVAKIERFEGSKADYVCHFPIHQDGSCNGLQHYAAIGRDQAGAESVNLHPFDVPKDVYSDVVDLVEKARKVHAEEGKEIAQVLDGFIKRKVIKQTIMTTVYGVTRYGAREQIHRQLKDIPDFPEEEAWRGSMYLTQTTFSCLREMFTAAKDIQDWLTEVSSLISAFLPVDWVTPLGFPVLQPYFKRVNKQGGGFDRFKPNTMKQKNAFPPNYIHSLDSTHMMLTALYCVHAGITFVSVHDCYWTHACDVPTMNRICREQFVSMHKEPLLEDLSEHLIALIDRAVRDPNLVEVMKKVDVPALLQLLQNVPKRGSFDLDNVLKSTYFFS